MRTVEKTTLPNGITFTVAEQSRLVAADRWYVKVVGTISLPLTGPVPAEMAEEPPALLARMRQSLGDSVEHRLVRDRNFVDAAVKEEVVKELVAQLRETLGSYLAGEAFPVRLMASKFREARELCLVEMAREELANSSEEEPADFSHCFR